MSEKDEIKDLFREKLQSHEVAPGKGVWENVSASLSNSAAAAGGAGSSLSLVKVAASVIGFSSLGVALYFIVQEYNSTEENELKVVSVPSEEKKAEDTDSESAMEVKAQKTSENKEESSSSEIAVPPTRYNPYIDDSEIESANLASEQSSDVEFSADATDVSQEDQNTSPISEDSQDNPASNENAAVSEAPDNESVSEPTNEVNDSDIVEETVEATEETEEMETDIVEQEEQVILPNVFTPNSDGINDFFEIEMSEKQDFQIIVIDRTNSVVYQSNTVDFRWDGSLPSGDPAPAGNYVYFISAKTLNGNDFVKSSALRIER